MASKDAFEYFRSLQRKELQALCKKHGLPANRSTSDMAESLISYLEKNSLSPNYMGSGLNGTQNVYFGASLFPTSQPAPLTNCRHDMREDWYGVTKERLKESFNPTINLDRANYSMGNKAELQDMVANCRRDCRVSALNGCVGDRTNRGLIDGGLSLQNGNPQYAMASCSIPFEFYASSEEGINLCVDLNHDPSDWINKLKRGVSICDDIHCKKRRRPDDGPEHFTDFESHPLIKPDVLHNSGAHMPVEPFTSLEVNESRETYNPQYKDQWISISSVVETQVENHSSLLDHRKRGNKRPSTLKTPATKQIFCTEPSSKAADKTPHDFHCVGSLMKKRVGDSVVYTSKSLMSDSSMHYIPKICSDKKSLEQSKIETKDASVRNPLFSEWDCGQMLTPEERWLNSRRL